MEAQRARWSGLATVSPAHEQAANIFDRPGLAPGLFCGEHPLGARLGRLVAFDLEAVLALYQDPAARDGVRAYLERAGHLPAVSKPGRSGSQVGG